MIEPANTFFARFIYRHFHKEVFNIQGDWASESLCPLSGANIALPWIIFFRDKKKFIGNFPDLIIQKIYFHTPLRYLVSGGLSMRQLLPSFAYSIVKILELALSPFNRYFAMFFTIYLEKNTDNKRES